MDFSPENGRKLDLHGCQVKEAVETFLQTYNRLARSRNAEPLIVVHGYGSSGKGGTIRTRLRRLLDRYPQLVSYQRGEVLGNPGMTIVLPHKPLPTGEDLLEQQILSYCSTPRTMEKITGKFRKFGQPQVLGAIRSLERQGLIQGVSCGRHRCFQSIAPD